MDNGIRTLNIGKQTLDNGKQTLVIGKLTLDNEKPLIESEKINNSLPISLTINNRKPTLETETPKLDKLKITLDNGKCHLSIKK